MTQVLKNKKVLIVDDDVRNIFALSSYLESCEMDVETAKDGLEALGVLRKNNDIDIVLLDMMMPEMDGYETLSALRKENKLNQIPVIAVTARAMVGDREKCISAGAWDYIPKPIDLKVCLEKLVFWLQKNEGC